MNDMFMDGMIYGGLSTNLSNNIGEFWKLHFSNSSYQIFHEHPPLAIYLESIFLRLIKKDIIIIKLYSILTFFVTAFIISLIWIKLGFKTIVIPLLIWFSIPIVRWSSWNNLLENTMTIFCISSVLFYIISINKRNRLPYLIFTGLNIFLAFLSKGVFSLYLLGIPFYYFLITNEKNIRKFFYEIFVIIFTFIISIFFIIHYDNDGAQFFEKYITYQIVNSVQNVVTQKSRFFLIYSLIAELLTPILIIAIIYFILKTQNKSQKINKEDRKLFFFFFITGLCGVFPLLISMKQTDFYITSTYPLFSIAFGVILKSQLTIIKPIIKSTILYIKTINFLLISGIILLITSNNYTIRDLFLKINETFTNYNTLNNFYTPSRVSFKINKNDKIVLEDINNIVKYLKFGETIYTDEKTRINMKIQGYFVIKKNVTLQTINIKNKEDKIILFKKSKELKNLKNYKIITRSNKKINLYYKKSIKQN